MNGYQALLLLRLIELAVMGGALYWIIMSPYSQLRRTRLAACWFLILMNLAAIVVAVAWAKITLW